MLGALTPAPSSHVRPAVASCSQTVRQRSLQAAVLAAALASIPPRRRCTVARRRTRSVSTPAEPGSFVGVARVARSAGRCARAASEGQIKVALAIGKSADKARRKRLTEPERRKLRLQEISNKVKVLRGRAEVRYRRHRDLAQAKEKGEDSEQESQQQEEESGSEQGPDQLQPGQRSRAEEGGEAPKAWAYKRDEPKWGRKRDIGAVSEETRAVMVAELEGSGGTATARQMLDAAEELSAARDFAKAAELLELARPRIDSEQLQRRIDALEAQSLDDRCLWLLGKAYEKLSRLTLAADAYGTLKDRLLVKADRVLAERHWAAVTFKLAEELYSARRFEECLEVVNLVLDTTTKARSGDKLVEDVQMYAAMTLQSLGRVDEAVEILEEVMKSTYDKKRKAQASFVLDVFSVEESTERNEEFHKVWDDNFRLPEDSIGQVRIGSGNAQNLTPRQREWKEWTSKYWEERMKSPLYYLFLTLWVTWPFAIPLIAILKKADLTDEFF